MAAYLIIEGVITDTAKWMAYRHAVLPLIEGFGGKQLNAPGGKLLEGEHDDWIVALFAFDSMQQIDSFWTSPDYVPVKALREGAAITNIRAIPGL